MPWYPGMTFPSIEPEEMSAAELMEEIKELQEIKKDLIRRNKEDSEEYRNADSRLKRSEKALKKW